MIKSGSLFVQSFVPYRINRTHRAFMLSHVSVALVAVQHGAAQSLACDLVTMFWAQL